MAGTQFSTRLDPALAAPRLYPTLEGGLRAEWSLDTAEISLDINLTSLISEYSSLDLGSL